MNETWKDRKVTTSTSSTYDKHIINHDKHIINYDKHIINDDKHIINLIEDNFDDILMGAASSCRNVIAS